ncbi:hypothetical protein C8J57DRAFT_1502930 [Mycena rebaudengoi]|nr:hypothetical protein C8J57DRAFT_1502930 [Mycena rebaudengoi]
MPLKLVRRLARHENANAILQLTISLTALTKDLATMTCFPPTTALVAVLLLIMETVQDVQTNKEDCNRLARRCATMTLNINDQMAGRWDSAPPMLLKNLAHFQETLESIHNFLKQEASAKWKSRFMRKNSIESALVEYHERLDDAARSFQISTLIEIHYAMNSQTNPVAVPVALEGPSLKLAISEAPQLADSPVDTVARTTWPLLEIVSHEADDEEVLSASIDDSEDNVVSEGVLQDHGFRRYHRSEVVLKGRPQLADGWWSGTSEAQVSGQPSLIKRYDGPKARAMKEWVRDVRVLQRLYHPNLPQMVGYSTNTAPTPFIVLSNVQTRSPESFLIGSLQQRGVGSCVEVLLRFYSDIVDAVFYAQQQLGLLSEEQMQDFLDNASFRINGENGVIVGLPILDPGTTTWRSYPLAESLRKAVFRMLPNQGFAQSKQDSAVVVHDPDWKLTHVTTLLRGLLPSTVPGLPLRVKSALSADFNLDSTSSLSLQQLRMLSIEANAHSHVWQKNSSIPPHKFSVGDIGYIPPGSDWESFCLLENVIDKGLASLAVEKKASGVQWCWMDGSVGNSVLHSFDLPGSVKCWPVAVAPGAQMDCQIVHEAVVEDTIAAWKFLLDNAAALAQKWSVPPESLILITDAGTNRDFSINDFAGAAQIRQDSLMPSFWRAQPSIPRIMYLLTSDQKDYEPYWCHIPITTSPRPDLEHGWGYKIGW